MKNAFILARKDIASYFHSWLGVLVFIFFFLTAGIFYSFLVLGYARLSVEAAHNAYEGVQGLKITHFVFGSFFLNMSIFLMFLVPLVSMRAFSEERKNQTLELLFTYPFSDFDIVCGKFLGLVGFFVLLLSPTVGYVFLLKGLGAKLDWSTVLLGYAGFSLLATAYLSLGLFVSSLTDNQVISAIVTFGCLVLLWIFDWGSAVSEGSVSQWLVALSPVAHYREFTAGILDLSHVVYFCFFSLYFLFLTLRSIETRNWKG